MIGSSVDPAEVAKFARLAEQWWNPNGPFAPLHKFNPIRLRFIRDVVAEHFGRVSIAPAPFDGLSLLDIGCGGGLLSEPVARLGFDVTGCDAATENVRVAAEHARRSGIAAEYRCATAEVLRAEKHAFDVVLAMEIVEHVTDVSAFVQDCTAMVKPGGLLIIATINRTLKALALAKFGAEYVLRWVPYGTHNWNRFVAPKTLSGSLQEAGLQTLRCQGIIFNPFSWEWQFSPDTDVNYVLVASRPSSVA